jgi:succinate-semialdehyde dehydrogenase/glutarate-semialdehyde dehydrogenase
MLYRSISPTTGEVLASFPTVSDDDLQGALRRADLAYQQDWRRSTVSHRREIISRAAALLRERADEFAHLLTIEMGKRAIEARMEVGLSAAILDYYAKNAEGFLAPQPVDGAPGALLISEPVGVILAIEPWNFPYYQVVRVVGPQLMAGNVVMLKHAESVPQCALALERLFQDAGVPAGVYTNLFATHEQIERLIADPAIRGVTVTGSERAGAAVAQSAGRNLKKIVMELGGSDPMIVLEDAPIDWVVAGALSGRMANAGQCCVGTKRVIVVGAERGREILEKLAARMAAIPVGDPADSSVGLGPVVSERALTQLLDQIQRAVVGGARLVTGGRRVDRPGFFLQPTILTDIAPSNPIYREELFGPVMSFYVVEDEMAALELANATSYGLGACVFSADVDRAQSVAARLDSGMVFINQPFKTLPQLPFGGIKNSGFGRELSVLGFTEFLNRKLVTTAPVGAPAFG